MAARWLSVMEVFFSRLMIGKVAVAPIRWRADWWPHVRDPVDARLKNRALVSSLVHDLELAAGAALNNSMANWTVVNFGKYEGKGKTLPQVLLSDPDYFFWALDKGAFKGSLAAEAANLNHRARNIRIPPDENGKARDAEYLIHRPTMKFGAIHLIPKKQSTHQGGSPVFCRMDRIDLSVPRRIKEYDKRGCKLLIDELRYILFGDSKARITKARAEQFFEDDSNFIL